MVFIATFTFLLTPGMLLLMCLVDTCLFLHTFLWARLVVPFFLWLICNVTILAIHIIRMLCSGGDWLTHSLRNKPASTNSVHCSSGRFAVVNRSKLGPVAARCLPVRHLCRSCLNMILPHRYFIFWPY